MGQTVSFAPVSAGAASINVRELADLSYEKSLGSARFMKSIRARHKNGVVVVRISMRPFSGFDFGPYVKKIRQERDQLVDIPNALGFVRIIETEHIGYLCRQYLSSSLYDRISTRPFLEDIEKKWLAFQLLCAVRDCHARNVYHGDIKAENVLVTSWNWLYLTDFSSSFKKTYLPEDNPADFSYFFDTSGRRTCYLAPERFLSPGQEPNEQGITWAMDVFSAGCVIAELFLETPIFTLSSLFRYRTGEYNPSEAALKRIEDPDIRELVAHMIQLEPESRYSAEEYLNFWRRKAFPEYFYSFLHQYMWLITDPSSGRNLVDPEASNFGEADERIDRVYLDFDKISYFLDYNYDGPEPSPDLEDQTLTSKILPVQLDIPNNRHTAARRKSRRGADDGSLIFLTLVVASIRSTARATARIRACDLMLAFAERLSDDAKLDRILPFLGTLLSDPCDDVKMAAVRSVVQLLDLVEVVSPVNAHVFTEYIRPRMQGMVYEGGTHVGPTVRATYAACLASLAHSSLRILDMVQALRTEGAMSHADPDAEDGETAGEKHRSLYDGTRSELIDHFETHAKALLTDPDTSVRRAFLGSVSSLCVFFGPARAADVIVSHLNTYLNDKDWMLKCAFFRTIVGVASFIGSTSFEDFILPLMLQALTDPEDFVVEKVLSSFASMAELGLFQRAKLFEMIDVVARFMMHPNYWIREASVHFISAASTFLSVADIYCLILPLLQVYLKTPVTDLSEAILLDSLKRPLSRAVLEMAVTWSQKVDKGIFWKPQKDQQTFSFRGPDHSIASISSKDLSQRSLQKMPKNHEDEQWLGRLNNLGLNLTEDGFKLVALREYIVRKGRRRGERKTGPATNGLNSLIDLESLKVQPQTIRFEKQDKAPATPKERTDFGNLESARKRGHTLTDALLDASQSIDERPGHARRPSRQGSRDLRSGSAGTPQNPIPHRGSNGPSPLSSSPSTAAGILDGKTSSTRPGLVVSDSEGRRHSMTNISESARPMSGVQRVKGLKHRSSAISLLGRRDNSAGSRGIAQTSTSAAHAAGEMDGPFTQDETDDVQTAGVVDDEDLQSARRKQYIGHNYQGGDPNVTRLLDSLAAHSVLQDDAEFGPQVVLKRRKDGGGQSNSSGEATYRPKGVHVATFSEHTGAINQLLPAPDHAFFLSASDDGSVKVWDKHRFERSLIHKSRCTHHHSEGSKVTCIAFVENTHTFISCATDGTVQVVKLDFSWVGESPKYGRLRLRRNYQLRHGEYAVWCAHFNAVQQSQESPKSVLLLLANTGRILAIDLRSLNTLYTITVPQHYGTPTTACMSMNNTWILVGTSTGILALYDLRFQLGIRSWGFVGAAPINKITLYERPRYHDTTSNSNHQVPLRDERGDRTVIIAGGTGANDLTVWDIEKLVCVEIFRVGLDGTTATGKPQGLAMSKDAHRALQPVLVDDMRPEELLSRIDNSSATEAGQDQSPRALTAGSTSTVLAAAGHAQESSNEVAPTTRYLLSAGFDRKVRFWAPSSLASSAVLSGLASEESQPKYTSVQSALMPGLVMNVEIPDARPEKTRVEERRRVGRTLTMQREQQALLRGHLDAVTDVCVLEGREGRLIISADRKGVIYVYQ